MCSWRRLMMCYGFIYENLLFLLKLMACKELDIYSGRDHVWPLLLPHTHTHTQTCYEDVGFVCCLVVSFPSPVCWSCGMLCLWMASRLAWSTISLWPCSCTSEKSVSQSPIAQVLRTTCPTRINSVPLSLLSPSHIHSNWRWLCNMYASLDALPYCLRSQLPSPESSPPQESCESKNPKNVVNFAYSSVVDSSMVELILHIPDSLWLWDWLYYQFPGAFL